jgi:hypothetical protein
MESGDGCVDYKTMSMDDDVKKFPSHLKHLSFMKQQAKREN